MIDPVEFGRSIAAIIKEATAPLIVRIEELETRQPVKGDPGQDGKDGKDGLDGQSFTLEDVAPLIRTEIQKAVSEIPPAEPGKDGRDGADGKDGESVTAEDVAPLVRQEVEKSISQLPPAEPGKDGRDGIDGKDGDSVTVEDVIAEIVRSDNLAIEKRLESAVSAYFESNPVKHGIDGKDGERGAQGERGERGDPGRDGLDIKDMFRAEGGRLVAVMSDGTTKDLGQFVGADGKDGKDGRDGLGFDDCEVFVSTGQVTLTYTRGDLTKSVSYPIPDFGHIGFWSDGMSAKAGQQTTHDGCSWMALRDTRETPSYKSQDWQLTARKGADGQRGAPGKDYKPPEPVSLKGKKSD